MKFKPKVLQQFIRTWGKL